MSKLGVASHEPIPSSIQVCAHTCNWSPCTGAGHWHKMALRSDTVYSKDVSAEPKCNVRIADAKHLFVTSNNSFVLNSTHLYFFRVQLFLLLSFLPIMKLDTRGAWRHEDFSKGGHTGSHTVALFSSLVVGCLLKIWLTREDHRQPRTPPP